MADVGDLAALDRKLARVSAEFTGQAGRARLQRVAKAAAKDADEAVRADLGDLSMSGWRRGRPRQIVSQAVLLNDHEAAVQPVKQARGPMRVLEQGRNMGNAGGFAGPGVNASTGLTARTKSGRVRKVRARRARRWNGYTQGKGTWTDAGELMERRVPGRFEAEVARSLGQHLTRG